MLEATILLDSFRLLLGVMIKLYINYWVAAVILVVRIKYDHPPRAFTGRT